MKSKEMGVIFNIIAELWTGPNKKLTASAKTVWQKSLSSLDFTKVRDALEREYQKDPNKLPRIVTILESSKSPAATAHHQSSQQLDLKATEQTIHEAERYLRRMSEQDLNAAESLARGCPISSSLVKRRWTSSWIATVYNTVMELEDL